MGKMIRKALLILLFLIMITPMYIMVVGSFQNIVGVMKMPPALLPVNPTMENYSLMTSLPFIKWISNTLFVIVVGTVLSVFVSASTGYVFAFYTFKFKATIWAMMIVGIMIPRISIIIPTFVTVKMLGISGTLWAVILPLVYVPVSVYLSRVYIETIPKSLLESARLDGASEFQVLTKVVMPMSVPILTLLALGCSILFLGDYFWQMLVLQKNDNNTFIVGMIKWVIALGANSINAGANPIGKHLSVGTVLMLPLFLIFMLANKYFTQDIGGAIKE
jgi:ABC-type glycerol-3-phosphate transport system permease component